MTVEERLQKKIQELETEVEYQQIEMAKLAKENTALFKSLKVGNSGWYIYYLQQSLKRLEDLHTEQQETIESYIKHFNRFRHYISQTQYDN